MLSRKNLRLMSMLVIVLLLAAAAIAFHEVAGKLAHPERFVTLGPASEAILAVLFAFLGLLACRHLTMLGLAAYDHCTQASEHAAPDDPAHGAPFVSIIVPAFNEAAMIRNVLESLLAIEYPRFEIIVVDDGSSDQTFLRALPFQRRRPGVECRVLAKPNGGKFDALNHGIAQARGEIIVCIDGDSMLRSDALERCVAHFADPKVGAVAGNVRVANRGTAWSALQALEYVAGYGLIKRAQSAARVVTIVPGPLGAFRKTALSQVNGYDGDTFAEDFDLTLKLLAAGWHVVYEPRAVVLTEAPERTLELLRQRYRWTRGSLQALLKRRRGLCTPRQAPLRFIALWYLMAEYLAWPVLHVGAQALFIGGGLWLGVHELMICWWLQLIVLESAVAAFCVAVEDEQPWLIAISPLFRVFYLVVLDVARLLAAAEEFARVGMSWDKVSRLGRFTLSNG
jgi:poly-beta-1,6-N-acetyl-D-glucosamine synthase